MTSQNLFRRSIALVLLFPVLACGGGDGSDSPDMGEDMAAAVERPEGAEAQSLLGEWLYPPDRPAETLARQQEQLAEAQADLDAAPQDADAIIWAGRRHAYLGHYRTAIDLYSHGAELHPEDARFLRHRGHRYISVREFDNAIADFERAVELIEGTEDEVEPDGAPNALGIPTSSLHYNIWYHLGLSRYLVGDFPGALAAYESCRDVATNNDGTVACSYWLYLINRRLGNDDEAMAVAEGIAPDLEIIENFAYHDLLMLYRGEKTEEEVLGGEEDALQNATKGYGVAIWHMLEGRTEESDNLFQEILAMSTQWASFGYLATEAEIARRMDG